VAISKDLRKYSVAFYLFIILASASLASANGLGLPYDQNAQEMNPANETSIKTCLGIGNECFTGYSTNFKTAIIDTEPGNTAAGPVSELFKQTAAITLHKGVNNTMWSLAPSISKYSLNPMEDVKRLQVMLQYSFRF